MLRDLSAVLLAVVAFLVADWLAAIAIAFGFLLFLILPHVFLFHSVWITRSSSALSPAIVRNGSVRTASRCLARYCCALPGVLLTDPAGLSTGLVWLACIGATIWIALPRQRPLMWPGPGWAAAVVALFDGVGADRRGER